jgi:hypothetical protein
LKKQSNNQHLLEKNAFISLQVFFGGRSYDREKWGWNKTNKMAPQQTFRRWPFFR